MIDILDYQNVFGVYIDRALNKKEKFTNFIPPGAPQPNASMFKNEDGKIAGVY